MERNIGRDGYDIYFLSSLDYVKMPFILFVLSCLKESIFFFFFLMIFGLLDEFFLKEIKYSNDLTFQSKLRSLFTTKTRHPT